MNKFVTTLASVAMVAAMSTGANAQGAGAEFSGWGMFVGTSNGRDDNNPCSTGGTEFCGDVGGWGASGSVYMPTNGNMSLSADLLYEFHFETNSDRSNRDDHPSYGAFGVHLTNESNPNTPWGGFVFLASGMNNADGDAAGPVFGLGAEVKVSDFVIQAGGMFLLDKNNADDTLENMGFIGVSREWQMGNGALTAGAMFGNGDFEEESAFYDKGTWGQLRVRTH